MPRLAALILLLSLAAAPAAAHHGWGTYDSETLLVLEGDVVDSAYEYPHGVVVIEIEGRRWECVLAPPSRMERRGLAAGDIAVGRLVRVEGYPSRVHEGEMRAERIVVDGRTVELR